MSDGNTEPVKLDTPNDDTLPGMEDKQNPANEAPSNGDESAPVPAAGAQSPDAGAQTNSVAENAEHTENKANEPSKHVLPNPALSSAASNDNLLREKHIGQVIDCIRNVVDGKKLTPAMLVRVVANCMMVTQKMKLSGPVKKKVVVNGLERYIRTCPDLDEEEVQVLMTAVDIVVDDAINVIAAVKSGDIKVKSCCVIV